MYLHDNSAVHGNGREPAVVVRAHLAPVDRTRCRVDHADAVPQFRLFFLLVHLHDHVGRRNRNPPKARAKKDGESKEPHNVSFREIENRVAIDSGVAIAGARSVGNRASISGTTLRPLSESSR